VDGISQKVLESLEGKLLTGWNAWTTQHPLVARAIEHPVLTAMVVFVILVLFVSLLQALGQLVVDVWLVVLRSPVRLVDWVWRGGKDLTTELLQGDKEKRKTEVLERLQELREEQQQLLEELKRLL